MWHEQKVRVQKALVHGRVVFIWLHMLNNSANSWGWDQAPASTSLAKAQEQCQGYQGQTHQMQSQQQPFAADGDWGLGCHFQCDSGACRERKSEGWALCKMCHSSPCPPWADLFCVWVSLCLLFIRSSVGGVALSPAQHWDPLCSALHKQQS